MIAVTMNDGRFVYLRKLVLSVKAEALKHRVMVGNDECVTSTWMDVELLCDVVEKEIINGEAK